ncbi:hypothetical protein SAMN05421741_10267 [Paenimyroides ummariense]|uniref:Uncharacterized protein n=1 Tax=Paenimyroides ummariense TaxID=913024 RepID=A0A1I4X1A7_9FLAO|nr:hypothetical protein [Paenimyroides ummariense]SFN19784.1 hypothetical protein SAMN05421741_10267 [Paenimyroides ummariense]
MKKMTFLAALLGVTQLSNAQVGIGTATPADAVQLEISATNKGVLIPRVGLTNTTTFSPITGTALESLLVYNTATVADVSPGFYYWVPVNGAVAAHWERIVNQTQLEEAISNITDLQGDVSKIITLLKVAFPANNLVDPVVTGDTFGGGMVFTPGTTPTIEYVYFDGTNYVKKDVTTDIIDLIKGAESKTTFIEFPAASGKYYYISEETINANNGVIPTSPFSTGTTLRPGVILLDVPQSVITNFQTILDGTTTIVKPGGSFYTVEEIIKMIASQVEGNVIYTNIGTTGSPNWVFQYWSDAANAGAGGYITINLTDLVGAAQSKTALVKTNTANAPVKQYFVSETYLIANGGTIPSQTVVNGWTSSTLPAGIFEIDIVAGVATNIQTILDQTVTITEDGKTFTTVEQYIQYIASKGDANVGYTVAGITAANNDGVAIPANSFYYINQTNGNKVFIDLGSIVKKNETKTKLITIGTKQYYVSESYTGTTDPTTGTETGVYEIDFIDGIVNNFNEFITSTVTGGGTNYTTVEEYIEYISANSMQDGVTKIVIDGTGQASFEQWNNATNTWVPVANTAFSTIVKANETVTTINKVQTGTVPTGDVEISYNYFNETPGATPQQSIDLNGDVLTLIEGNTDIQNAITNILNNGGNVYYGDHDSNPGTPNVFYTIVNNVKTPIDISEVVVNAITNATTVQKQEIKNQLGDTYNTATVTNTGDTWIDGGKIYAGIYDATVTGGTANVSTISLTPPAGTTALGKIVSIKLLNNDNNIINTSTTDVALSGSNLSFRIGTGNMYNVLSPSDLSIRVVVEFSAQ